MNANATIPETLSSLVVDVESLRNYPRNPRRGDVEAIKRSLEQHGQYRPIVVNATTREVLAGNHTLDAARALGWSEIAATFVDVDADTAARIVLIDNRANDLAEYDDAELVALLSSLPELDGTLYEQDDLDELLRGLELVEPDDEARERYDFDVYDRERVVDAAFAHYRETGMPVRSAPLFECMLDVNALRALPTLSLAQSTLGYRVADTYHPHRFDAKIPGKRTTPETFASDKYLRIAIEHVLDNSGSFTPAAFLSVLSLTRGTQAAANFRPGFALSLLRRFAPDDAVVLDASTGYGGRLVGFFASHCSTYIGVDPSTKTHAANTRMASDLCPDDKRVELHCLPAEDVEHELVRARCDVALTSPPYFAKEHYSDESTQSWKRYGEPEAWRAGFLEPLLALQHAALKRDSVNLLNVADVKVGKHEVPLVDWSIAAGIRAGFEIERVERYTLSRRWGPQSDVVASEPVIVMRKR